MITAQRSKYAVAIAPAAIIDNASATATAVDCIGASYCELICQLGATDIAITAMKVQECDTSGGSYADVTGATMASGTAIDGTTLVLPSATDDNQVVVFQVNMLGRKRFLKLVVTFGDGTVGGFISATARLSMLGQVPTVSTDVANGDVCRV